VFILSIPVVSNRMSSLATFVATEKSEYGHILVGVNFNVTEKLHPHLKTKTYKNPEHLSVN
jgi:hypothetical protein